MLNDLKIFVSGIKESIMKNSERSRPQLKPKFPRLKRLREKRLARWFTTADAEGNVQIHPDNR